MQRRRAPARRFAVLLAGVLLTTGLQPPLASAAVGATSVVPCRGGTTCWPAAFAFTPGGQELFYAERFTGQIRRVDLGTGTDRRWGVVPNVAGAGEQGLLGIALDPNWDSGPTNRWVYAYFTHSGTQQNRIVRMRKKTDSPGLIREIILRISPSGGSTNHNGGVIHFGPDDLLYAVTGERASPARAQVLTDPAGKVLRMNRNGTRPADNPIAGSLAFSYGHRNSFGFTFDPENGRVWKSENGPECDDEINPITPGGNHGWGSASTCPDTNDSGPMPRHLPAHTYNPIVVPTGAAFCDGCGLGSDVEGNLLVGTFGGGTTIRLLTMNATRDDVTAERVLYDHPSGVLAVETRPGGTIFFSDRSGIFRLTGP